VRVRVSHPWEPMSFDPASTEPHIDEPRRGFFAWWHDTPLYLRILGGMLLGLAVGLFLKEQAAYLDIPAKLILRLLSALAPSLILVAIIRALMTADLRGGMAGKLVGLLVLNTLVAIIIGLAVANIVKPGTHAKLTPPPSKDAPVKATDPAEADQPMLDKLHGYGFRPSVDKAKTDPIARMLLFLENVPDSLLRPLVENNKTIGVIFVAVAFGIALRSSRRRRVETLQDLVDIAFDALLKVLHWVIQIVPIGVFGVVAATVGKEGFDPFKALGAFIVAVLLALLLQASYYLIRVRIASWVSPVRLIRGVRDALVMAFSTASSTATMPVTYTCLRDRVGLRERSASMGSLVGANFNNDGTALYEAMSALFISQMLGINLEWDKQILVVLTSVVASVGAAGIPEAGLVTMTFVFAAVGLPTEYIALLISVDWFLDRCRTAINVMGDCNVSCVLDGKVQEPQDLIVPPPAEPAAA
jgi:Na+/H+-dicarboxylate symporter